MAISTTAIGWMLIPGCRLQSSDTALVADHQILNVRPGYYSSAAWLTDDRLAFAYDPEYLAGMANRRIVIYSIATSEWQELAPPPQPAECFSAWFIGPVERLPDGNLGLIFDCNLTLGGKQQTLVAWNPESNSLSIAQAYPAEGILARDFSFSPDMSQIAQHSAVGAHLSDELYLVQQDGTIEQLVPTFSRARTPSWSPNGETIAFWGTASYGGGDSSGFWTWGEIEALARHPWDLYLIKPDGSGLERILQSVSGVDDLAWSPDGKLLAFTGRLKNREGLWILHPSTRDVVLLTNGEVSFDWSPDRKRMFVIEQVQEGDAVSSRLKLVTLPPDLSTADQ